MKNHLKRIATQRTWILDRKGAKFTLRPNPGAHKFSQGLALGFVLRDMLKLTSTMSEVEKLLNNNDILVDGKKKKDRKEIVGLFDRISIPVLNKHYTLNLDFKGRLIAEELSAKDVEQKICKVVGKTVIKGGKLQLNLYDGKNILTDKTVKVGDSVILSLPKLEIKEVLPLKEGVKVFLTKGKHAGASGKLKSLEGETARYLNEAGEEIETTKKYLYVMK